MLVVVRYGLLPIFWVTLVGCPVHIVPDANLVVRICVIATRMQLRIKNLAAGREEVGVSARCGVAAHVGRCHLKMVRAAAGKIWNSNRVTRNALREITLRCLQPVCVCGSICYTRGGRFARRPGYRRRGA